MVNVDCSPNLMNSLSPIADCGSKHYGRDVADDWSYPGKCYIGARLMRNSGDNYNYGQLQIRFEDGSVGLV